jgi:hypothetical protein
MYKNIFILFITIISFSAKAQDYSQWSTGCYYDLNNARICGQIYWNVPNRSPFRGKGGHIFYKASKDDKKQKIQVEQFKCFVMQADSFVVSHDTALMNYPILKVIIDKPLKLYVCLRLDNTSSNGMMFSSIDMRYYYGKDPDNLTELDRSHFIGIMSELLADDKDLVAAIKNKTYRYGKIYKVLEQYKTFQQNQKPILAP